MAHRVGLSCRYPVLKDESWTCNLHALRKKINEYKGGCNFLGLYNAKNRDITLMYLKS